MLYIDTCGAVTYQQSNGQLNYGTGCGSNSNGGLQRVKQSILWNAIIGVPVDSTDGGWVW